MSKAAAKSKPSAKPRGKPWPKGQSGNPAGAPKRGQSWAELIKEYGELTPGEAAAKSLELSKKLLSIGEGVTLKQAVVLRVYGSLLFEPQPGLLNAFMERAEGKVSQPVTVEPSAALLARMEELGLTLTDVRSDPFLAQLFKLAGISVDAGAQAAGTVSGAED